MNAVDIIAKKRDGGELSTEEIRFIVAGITSEFVPDYQAAAWLMAVFLRGMSPRETLDLTMSMRDSGERIDLSDLDNGPALDKHSTGGVGDKTSLVVVPILAAAGVPILKMSGRGLGYSGGTVDKLESIPGLRTALPIDQARDIVKRVAAVMIGQSSQLAPADKILYALRDVTATIESIPLVAASIMSKKLAAGGQRILLDVKCGLGSFTKTRDRAELLAKELVAIGNAVGVPTVAVLSAMDEPLGYTIGNALEVREAIETMQARAKPRSHEAIEPLIPGTSGHLPISPSPPPPVFRSTSSPFVDLCLELAAHGLVCTGKAVSLEHGREIGAGLLESGAALLKFSQMVSAQGGPDDACNILSSLPTAAATHNVAAYAEGFVTSVNAEAMGRLAMEMGAGRLKKSDAIDHATGIVLHCKAGSHVSPSSIIATLHLRGLDIGRACDLADRLRAAFRISDTAQPEAESLVLGVVR